ncbi:adenylyl-sulfate kinase [Streptomyces sp. NPDC002088]|uniref:adenylyl-sulfate kinase n=1 Tax=Streptomyces sp. NPDC002088 TaxID=3154665 RepID=UPI00332CC7CA
MPVYTKPCDCGVTVWLTGSPGSGTTPLAHALAELLRGAGHQVAVLEAEDVRRAGLTAEILARNGVLVLVSAALAHPEDCGIVRRRHGKSGTHFLEALIAATKPDTPLVDSSPHAPDLAIPPDLPEAERPSLLLGLLSEKRFLEPCRISPGPDTDFGSSG